jgi:hypothetical protein
MKESQIIREYDETIDDDRLKQLIIKRVKAEDDRQLLDRLYQTLQQTHIDDRIAATLGKDPDAKSQLQRFSRLILDVDGTYQEKVQFIDDFEKGFVDTKKLLTKNSINSFSSLFDSTPFVQKVASALMPVQDMGIGPGEYALSILSPKISNSGRLNAPGDLKVDGVHVEVKAQKKGASGKVSGGRFYDGRKAQLDIPQAKRELEQAGFVDIPARINLTAFVSMIGKLPEQDRKKVTAATLSHIFKFYNPTDLVDAIVAGDVNRARKMYIKASYLNYKAMSKFDGMLLIDVSGGRTLYFDDVSAVIDMLKSNTVYVIAPDQEVFPQIKF